MSSANLRAAEGMLGGKVGLLRLLEYACGIIPDFKFTGVNRCGEQLRKLFKQRAAARGDRAQKLKLQLPPMWCLVGVYTLCGYDRRDQGQAGGGTASILHRSMQKIAVIPLERLPPCPDPVELTIECNWSETGGYVGAPTVTAGEADGLKVFAYFQDSCVTRSSP